MLYARLVKPVLFRMDPEDAHERVLLVGRILGSNPATRGLVRAACACRDPMLVQRIRGVTFPTPVGLAAGFDKDAYLLRTLPAVGFGFAEIGSVTAEPYGGNPRPRLVRLPKDESIIVYYGLKSEGAARRLVDAFVAQTKIDDWIEGIEALKGCGDYLTINVSCPNTCDPHTFAEPALLKMLLARIAREARLPRKPVFLKLSADMPARALDRIVAICDRATRGDGTPIVSGFILTNLVKDRASVALRSDPSEYEGRKGGLSGRPVAKKALALTRHAYVRYGGRYVIVSCGGIFTAQDAYERIRNGASLVQLVTGMIYGGPFAVKRITKGLVALLKRDGFASVSEAVGADARASARWARRSRMRSAPGRASRT